MPNRTSRIETAAGGAEHHARDRKRALRWTTLTILLLLAAVAASRV